MTTPQPPSTQTTCPYCGVGCGVLAARAADGTVSVQGDPSHPANYGRLCSKGAALGDTVDLDGRLLQPVVRGEQADWDSALDAVANGFRRIIAEHGPEGVAFYGSGQMLTEDYYVSNKLFKGFIGTPHVDTNSRLCMASAVVGHKRAFGADTVPGNYEDLEQAELLVLTGSNLAWCHPVLHQRVKAAKAENPEMRVVVIDPRRTETCEIADLHLPLAPGTDVWLWNGLLAHLAQEGQADYAFLEAHTEGFGEAINQARRAGSVPEVAAQCDLPEGDVMQFFRLFTRTRRTVSLYSQGVNQSSVGTDKVNAIINCHLLTGRIGRPGTGPFSITGQPNAMGGREVGGLANQLAAHMDFAPEDVERVRRFWGAPNLVDGPGNKAVDLFQAIERGEIKAVWIMATNPAVSLPDADRMRVALGECELVVVSEAMRSTDTTAVADVLLPALTWGEKDGTVTNSERRISRQRAFLPPPGEARADWWALSQVARRLGFGEAFAYDRAHQIFDEHARLSAFENDGTRDFDLGGLTGMDAATFAAMTPRQWPVRADGEDTARLFGAGGFFTPSGRARFVTVEPRAPENRPESRFPLVLNSGRVRDHWHTMTRTGKAARLSSHTVEPFVQAHPDDASASGVSDGALARVASRWGDMLGRARIDRGQRRGSVFVPMHWNDQYASRARAGAVVNPVTDPLSGEPEFKHTPVSLAPAAFAWHGFLLLREAPDRGPDCDWWALARGECFVRFELAGNDSAEDLPQVAERLMGGRGEWMEFADPARHSYRAACLRDGRLMGCLFMGQLETLPPRSWLAGLFRDQELDSSDRMALLSGRPPAGEKDVGRTVCSCFGVGENTIVDAIADGAMEPAAVTQACQAGGNCGSCLPELQQLIVQHAVPANRRSA
ncbi:nitrate reductase [Aquisalimonas sp.]|uniref:nitrate reductase n=1 Tax=Aquisalimonas sp. TaxID=1872621 RepID=UPI0025C0B01A|nr:nitrate reductase [Aquisalimonas sp.]